MNFPELVERVADGTAPERALHSIYVSASRETREALFLAVVGYALMQRARREQLGRGGEFHAATLQARD